MGNTGTQGMGKRRQWKELSVHEYVWEKQALDNNDFYKH